MKLYVTSTSPYARIVKMLILEKGLSDRIELVEAKTRTVASPYYNINISGRVPYLEHADGWGMEDSPEILAYLDSLDANPTFIGKPLALPLTDEQWRQRQLQARATSLLDGVSVWIREIRRPVADQSATIIEHERVRALRLARWWEQHADHEQLQGALNQLQATLYCALDLDHSLPAFCWRETNPGLVRFMHRLAKNPNVANTSPYSDTPK